MKSFYVCHGRICKVFHFPDHIPAVRVSFGIQVFQDKIFIETIWLVIDTLAFFVLDHILLIDKSSLGNGILQISHPVRFEP